MFKLSEVPSIRTHSHTHNARLCVCADGIFPKTEVSAIINTNVIRIIYIYINKLVRYSASSVGALRNLNITLITHRFHYNWDNNLTESCGNPLKVVFVSPSAFNGQFLNI